MFSGKYAFVTGGSKGIGKAICEKLASKGCNIALNYRNEEDGLKVKAELEAYGVQVLLVKGDISSFDETKAMFDTITKEFGRLDILVNNAGITKDNLIMRMSEQDFDQVIDVNLKGTWNCMKHATKIMSKQRYGKIISISSVVGLRGNAGQVNYAASKAGIIGMSKSLARELARRKVNVNVVAPGFIQTRMSDVLSDAVKEQILSEIPLQEFGNVEDIANAVAFLASDEARYITGQVLSVDGGMEM